MAAGSFRRSIASQVGTAPSYGWRGAGVPPERDFLSVPSQRVPPARAALSGRDPQRRARRALPRPAPGRGALWNFPLGLGWSEGGGWRSALEVSQAGVHGALSSLACCGRCPCAWQGLE